MNFQLTFLACWILVFMWVGKLCCKNLEDNGPDIQAAIAVFFAIAISWALTWLGYIGFDLLNEWVMRQPTWK